MLIWIGKENARIDIETEGAYDGRAQSLDTELHTACCTVHCALHAGCALRTTRCLSFHSWPKEQAHSCHSRSCNKYRAPELRRPTLLMTARSLRWILILVLLQHQTPSTHHSTMRMALPGCAPSPPCLRLIARTISG